MKTYQVGPDELDGYSLERLPSDAVWVVYHYSNPDGYQGSGVAVVAFADGRYGVYDLGHCSCYGAIDPTEKPDPGRICRKALVKKLTIDDSVPGGRERVPADCDYAAWSAIGPKVRELLGPEPPDVVAALSHLHDAVASPNELSVSEAMENAAKVLRELGKLGKDGAE